MQRWYGPSKNEKHRKFRIQNIATKEIERDLITICKLINQMETVDNGDLL